KRRGEKQKSRGGGEERVQAIGAQQTIHAGLPTLSLIACAVTATSIGSAQRPRSPAARSRSDGGAEAVGSQVQRFVSWPSASGIARNGRLPHLYPVNSSPGLTFGYLATLCLKAAIFSITGRSTQPMSIVCCQRFELSPGSLSRSYTMGNCTSV